MPFVILWNKIYFLLKIAKLSISNNCFIIDDGEYFGFLPRKEILFLIVPPFDPL